MVVEYMGFLFFYLYGGSKELYGIDKKTALCVMYQQRKEGKNKVICIIEVKWN
jgi:hypothetical protein